MKRLALAISACVLSASTAWSQPPHATKAAPSSPSIHAPINQITPTPDMWFYDQAARQYADPSVAVRKKAEFDMRQRQHRIASSAWYGVSNARPNANITPFMGQYAPTWVSNTRYPQLWSGQTTNTTVMVPAGRSAALYGLW